ncbi:Uncharacterised protein [Mycobacteroides abscessus subsp. abscessus]|nr:Uncharacterised protein [Mycobacteroides abscessus subsp. abscessus]
MVRLEKEEKYTPSLCWARLRTRKAFWSSWRRRASSSRPTTGMCPVKASWPPPSATKICTKCGITARELLPTTDSTMGTTRVPSTRSPSASASSVRACRCSSAPMPSVGR